MSKEVMLILRHLLLSAFCAARVPDVNSKIGDGGDFCRCGLAFHSPRFTP